MVKADMANLISSINQYQAEYGRLPSSSNAIAAAVAGGSGGYPDFTFGTTGVLPPSDTNSVTSNSGRRVPDQTMQS